MDEFLLSDIGGTNVRFALSNRSGTINALQTMPVQAFQSFESALRQYLTEQSVRPVSLIVAAAGPVTGRRVTLTNAPWEIDGDFLSMSFDDLPVTLLNDLEAVAHALPTLGQHALRPVLSPAERPEYLKAPRLAINLGTGFGAAVAIPTLNRAWTILPTEAGHQKWETRIFAEERSTTVEGLLSGPGLAKARATWKGSAVRPQWSAELGQVIRNLVLATGSWGGVYLCGGLIDDFEALVDACELTQAFLAPGPMRNRLRAVPVWQITEPNPALLGLATLISNDA